jgi:diguanylate cyclase (GGDEF)-like protein/PAS domain S-box-containing protein
VGIVAVYVLVGVLWHLFADRLLFEFVRESAEHTRLEILIPDFLYVGLTTCLLYALIKRRMSQQLRSEEKLREERDKAQKYLDVWRESEETARGLLNAPTDTAILIDTEGGILAINQTAAQRLGSSVDDLIGLNAYTLIPPALARERKARADQVVQTGDPVRFEDMRDGIVFDNSIHPIFNAEGKVARLAIYGRDITEQKRAYEAVRRSEEYFRALIENALDAIGVIGNDGTIHYESPSAESVLGYRPEEMVGANAFDYIDPEHKERVIDTFEQVTKDPAAVWTEEFPCRHKDGSWRTIQISAKRLPNDQRVVVNYRDITGRKKAEEALRESERRYRSLAETVTDVIWTLDLKTLRLTFVTPSVAILRGYTAEEAMGQTLEQTLTPSSLKTAMQVLAEEVNSGNRAPEQSLKSRTLELEHLCRNGSTVWTEATVTFLRGADGAPVEVLGVSRDITARLAKLEALRAISLVDELTGLYNRRAFLALCEQQLKMANRAKKGSAIFFVDLDNMKVINDTFGHEEGDQALKETAEILRESFRESDIVARMGGDEFAIMAVEAPGDSIDVLTSRLQERIEARNAAKRGSYHLSLSIGAACYDPESPCTIDELLSRADKMMYDEKSAKKILGQAQFLRALKTKNV